MFVLYLEFIIKIYDFRLQNHHGDIDTHTHRATAPFYKTKRELDGSSFTGNSLQGALVQNNKLVVSNVIHTTKHYWALNNSQAPKCKNNLYHSEE